MQGPIALICLSGEYPDRRTIEPLLSRTGIVIAADGGWNTAQKLGLNVDVLIGDMDSIENPPNKSDEGSPQVLYYSTEKDDTDTELAISHARSLGYEDQILVGGGGGRLDHLLAIERLFNRDPCPKRWYTRNEEVLLIRESYQASVKIGSILSVFALGNTVLSAESEGLQWPLNGLSFDPGRFGISNRVSQGGVTIKVKTGRMLLIRYLDQGDQALTPGVGQII